MKKLNITKIGLQALKRLKWAMPLCLISLMLGVILAETVTPNTIYIMPGIFPGAPRYTIWKEGTNYFSKNANGQIEYFGTNPSQIVQNSLDHLTAGRTSKETVMLIGSFSLTTTLTIASTGYVMLDLLSATLLASSTYGDVIQILGEYVEIRGGIIDGTNQSKSAGIRIEASNVEIDGTTVKDFYDSGDTSKGWGIIADPYTDLDQIFIRNAKLIHNMVYGVGFSQIESHIVSNSTIENCYFQDIGGTSISPYGSENIKISGNIIIRGGGMRSEPGIGVQYGEHIGINDNVVIDALYEGIAIAGTNCSIVSNNRIYNPHWMGISTYQPDAHYNLIVGNEIYYPLRSGIYIYGSRNDVSTNKIIQGVGYEGIYIFSDGSHSSTQNRIFGNTIIDPTDPPAMTYGIRENAGGDYNKITENYIPYISGGGTRISTVGGSTYVHDNIVTP